MADAKKPFYRGSNWVQEQMFGKEKPQESAPVGLELKQEGFKPKHPVLIVPGAMIYTTKILPNTFPQPQFPHLQVSLSSFRSIWHSAGSLALPCRSLRRCIEFPMVACDCPSCFPLGCTRRYSTQCLLMIGPFCNIMDALPAFVTGATSTVTMCKGTISPSRSLCQAPQEGGRGKVGLKEIQQDHNCCDAVNARQHGRQAKKAFSFHSYPEHWSFKCL